MSTVETLLSAPPERVFQILSDPRTLYDTVAGTRNIRRFDPRWPEPGTSVHHSIGIGPLMLRDTTIVLEAHIRSAGTLRIEFLLEADAGGSRLIVEEHPLSGPLNGHGVRVVADALIKARNFELCRRLRRLVDRRERERRIELGDA